MSDLVPLRGELLSVEELAAYLRERVSFVRWLRRTRQIACVKVAGKVKFFKRDVDEYLERHRESARDESRTRHVELKPAKTIRAVDDFRDCYSGKKRLSQAG